jgi:hypothetical protein
LNKFLLYKAYICTFTIFSRPINNKSVKSIRITACQLLLASLQLLASLLLLAVLLLLALTSSLLLSSLQWLASLLLLLFLLSVEWVSCCLHGALIEQSSYIKEYYQTNFFRYQTVRLLNIVLANFEAIGQIYSALRLSEY